MLGLSQWTRVVKKFLLRTCSLSLDRKEERSARLPMVCQPIVGLAWRFVEESEDGGQRRSNRSVSKGEPLRRTQTSVLLHERCAQEIAFYNNGLNAFPAAASMCRLCLATLRRGATFW